MLIEIIFFYPLYLLDKIFLPLSLTMLLCWSCNLCPEFMLPRSAPDLLLASVDCCSISIDG